MILECKEKNGQMVMPVFYHVNPSDVKKQTRSFKDAFTKHEKNFKKMPETIQRWRAALIEASNLSGWDSMVIKTYHPQSDCEGLVGIDSRIYRIKSLLCIQLLDVKIVGIWRMGGIGKTTISGVVFNQFSSQFDGCCFIANIREESDKCGLVHIRNQLLSQILEEEEDLTLGTPIIPEYIKKRLQYRKVFIVLDDVSDIEQIEFLIGRIDRLGPGSRVIATTRDKQVLCNYGVENIYELEGFEYHEALQLFSGYAFKQKCPSQNFWELSNKVVDYAKGNPLALKVLGSSLYRKSVHDWQSVLHKLKSISNPKIHNVLKISYDGLDHEEQDIFLDIACFFKGENSKRVTKILDSCYFSTHVGLTALIEKSLVTISYNKLDMHDLIQEMGWEIIRKESFKELGKRSRLWNHDDVFHVLKNNMGTDAVQGLKYLPNELRYLYWHGYPLKTLPSNFSPINLIELQLPYSNVDVQLWVDNKHGSDV
ncbi:TMV resistance protein N-like [Pistacia vera]|uniref:TMV resistance protein N-like n=1 Tax=Pistacia vera TaxID=55513 RepID=UPI001262C2BA|nr:TMV resistance protein N-like [Pistacia vera]